LVAVLFATGCAGTKTSEPVAAELPDLQNVSLEAVRAYESKDAGRSLELYRQLVERDPSNHEFINNMGVVLLENGQNEAAAAAFERASILQPENTDYLVNAGFAQIRLKEYDEAEAFFDRALQFSPRNAVALYGKGVIFLYLDEPEISYNYFRQSVELDPSSAESLFMKAYSAQKNGLWRDAILDYTDFIELSQDEFQLANAYSNRALCFFRLEKFDEGMTDLKEAVLLNDNSASLYYNRGVGYHLQHRYEEAIQDYTRAIARDVGFPEAYINRGELNLLVGNAKKGCSDLNRACRLGYCESAEKYKAAGKCED